MNLRNELIRLAHDNEAARADILAIIKETDDANIAEAHELIASLKATATHSLDDHLILLSGGGEAGHDVIAKDDRRVVTKMVGMTKQKISQSVDAYSQASADLAKAEAEHKTVIAKLKKLKSVKDGALKPLTDAAKQLQEKGQICLQGRDAALHMTAYIQDKTPGIVQMMAEEDDAALRKGQKAGELYARLIEELGEEVAKTAFAVVQQVREDLTHSASAVRAVKLVEKAGDSVGAAKTAGIMKDVKDAFDWLSGQANRLFNFAGGVKDWVKGFFMRTKVCKGLVKDQERSFKNFKRQVESL